VFVLLLFYYIWVKIRDVTFVPAREMRPRELLKSSSSSFGRAGCWVLDWGPSHLGASPSALSPG